MALHGACWKHHDGVIEDAASWELKKEQNRTHNPLTVSCRDHRRCKEYDINMICPLNVKKCRCRPLVGMRWNPAEAECQVYVVRYKDFSIESVFFGLRLLYNHSKSPEKKMPSIEKSLVRYLKHVKDEKIVG